jgi:hypothetical protein
MPKSYRAEVRSEMTAGPDEDEGARGVFRWPCTVRRTDALRGRDSTTILNWSQPNIGPRLDRQHVLDVGRMIEPRKTLWLAYVVHKHGDILASVTTMRSAEDLVRSLVEEATGVAHYI